MSGKDDQNPVDVDAKIFQTTMRDVAWEPSAELRWVKVGMWTYKRDGTKGQDVAGHKHILQQRWYGRQTIGFDTVFSTSEWRDIPTITEKEAKREWDAAHGESAT